MFAPDVALGALLVLLATAAGALAAFFLGCIDRMKYSAMLAFAAGAMAFSSVEMLLQSHSLAGDLVVASGFAIGFLFLMASEKLLPHIHMKVRKKELAEGGKKAALIAGAISLHNVPEGFAIATAFAASGPLGWFVTTAIALQDIPEGALVSTPLACLGLRKRTAVLFGILSGAIEAAAAVLGYIFLSAFTGLVPVSLAFSAGAMTYVVFVEIMPDALGNGMERVAAAAFVAGAAVTFAIAAILAV
jgi:zinc transporter, ZIP family